MVAKILRGYGTVGNDTPVNKAYPLFMEMEQRAYDPEKAAFHYKKSGHSGPILLRTSDVAFPGAVDAAQLYQQSAAKAGITLELKREPGDGYWSDVWNKKPFCATYWAGKPTQDQVYTNSYISTSDWNDSHFYRKDFDSMLYAARSEMNPEKRKSIYESMGRLVHEEGGVVVPMFNDFIDATGPRIGGWVPDGNNEMMGGYALSKCWVSS
jgi:peptide/nickel transport system substrate-binding protein